MSLAVQSDCRNLLLRAMSKQDFALIAPMLRAIPLPIGDVLVERGDRCGSLWFPEAGIVTFSELLDNGMRLGIGHVGYEGFAGWQVVLGGDRSAQEIRVTAAGGSAYCISAEDVRAACELSGTLRALLLRYIEVFLTQLSRTIVSSLTQPVETRLCRWTLMAHDRIEGDEIKVTHEEIAVMLAIRRASVTDALHILEGEGLVRSTRGRVLVRDRDGLKRHAGETYGHFEAEYTRLIAPFPRHASR